MRKFIFICLFCIPWLLHSEGTVEDPDTHVIFSNDVSMMLDNQTITLPMTGKATRTKFFVKVYTIAHYMQNPPKGKKEAIFQSILEDNHAKELIAIWVHEASSDKIQEGYRESFGKATTPTELASIQQEVDQFIGYFNTGAQVHDQHIFRWLPGGVIQTTIQGQEKPEIRNPVFARALWNIWFGTRSVVNRNRLIDLLRN